MTKEVWGLNFSPLSSGLLAPPQDGPAATHTCDLGIVKVSEFKTIWSQVWSQRKVFSTSAMESALGQSGGSLLGKPPPKAPTGSENTKGVWFWEKESGRDRGQWNEQGVGAGWKGTSSAKGQRAVRIGQCGSWSGVWALETKGPARIQSLPLPWRSRSSSLASVSPTWDEGNEGAWMN